MAIQFDKDGTIHCNTVRYNYKQARNMIADGCYGNISGTTVWHNVKASTSPAGYKSYRCFQLAHGSSEATLTQTAPKPTVGHKYYGGLMYMNQVSSFTGRFVYQWFNSGTVGSGRQDFYEVYNLATNGNWVKMSGIIEFSSVNTGTWQFRVLSLNTPSADLFVTKIMVVDLTNTFGAGKEPTKEWCDENILEWEKFVNFGCTSSNITNSNMDTRWVANISNQPATVTRSPYLQDVPRFPREYLYNIALNTSTTNGSGFVSGDKYTFTNTNTYYFYFEAYYQDSSTPQLTGRWTTFNWPINYTLQNGSSVQHFQLGNEFCNGGAMSDWKRMSAYGDNKSLSSGSYAAKLYFNNNGVAGAIIITALNLLVVGGTLLTAYNTYNNSKVVIGDLNKAWCDRWVEGRSSPILHIKDPSNTKIEFKKVYDILCNDIEIHPETNGIRFDKKTGTIYCKKLVKTQDY